MSFPPCGYCRDVKVCNRLGCASLAGRISNEIGQIIEYTGSAPIWIEPQARPQKCAYCGSRAKDPERCDRCGAPA